MERDPSSGTDFVRATFSQGRREVSVDSTPGHRRRHPVRHAVRAKKLQRNALNCGYGAFAVRNRNQQVAAPRYGDGDGRMPCAVGHPQIIGPQSSGHLGNADRPARLKRRKALAHQIEVGDAIDFIVIGDAAVAIAKAGLRPHIDFDFAAAKFNGALEGAPGGPPVARKRPGNFAPALDIRTGGSNRRRRRSGCRSQRRTRSAVYASDITAFTAGRPPRARDRSAPVYAGRCWRDRRCRYIRAHRFRHYWSGSRPCSGPCRRW